MRVVKDYNINSRTSDLHVGRIFVEDPRTTLFRENPELVDRRRDYWLSMPSARTVDVIHALREEYEWERNRLNKLRAKVFQELDEQEEEEEEEDDRQHLHEDLQDEEEMEQEEDDGQEYDEPEDEQQEHNMNLFYYDPLPEEIARGERFWVVDWWELPRELRESETILLEVLEYKPYLIKNYLLSVAKIVL